MSRNKPQVNIKEFSEKWMGKYVTVTKKYVDKYGGMSSKRTWEAIETPAINGWVVGIRWLQNGVYHTGGTDYEGDYESPYFQQLEPPTMAVQICLSPVQKPALYVPIDGLQLAYSPLASACT